MSKDRLIYLPLGGAGEIGMNLYVYGYGPKDNERLIVQMLSHGFISGALFLCVGVIYDRMHTREIEAYGGLVNIMPSYAYIGWFDPACSYDWSNCFNLKTSERCQTSGHFGSNLP